MVHQFYLLKRKMVLFECVSIIELSTLKQFRMVMLDLELTNYSIVYMEQKSIRKSILQADIIKLGSILKTDIKQLFERDMDITNSRVGIVPSRLSSGVLGRTGRDSID